MSRSLIVAVCLLLLPVTRAWATEQVEERIVVGGRVFRMPTTPLEPFLDALEKRPFRDRAMSTDLWRGYVGTWLIEDDRLYLLSLFRYEYTPRESDRPSWRVAKDIPLSVLFGDQAAPIPATWWSGQLTVPVGNMLRYGWRSRERLYEKTLYINVTKGHVTARRLVDNREEGRGLSPEDLLWVTKAAHPVEDDGAWHDARRIRKEAFAKAVPSGTAFRTRGVLWVYRPTESSFWVPATPATDLMRFPLRDLPADARSPGTRHVELTASWERDGSEIVLRVSSVRVLDPGETIHHPDFVVPPLPKSNLPEAGSAPSLTWGSPLRDPDALPLWFGRPLALRGVLTFGDVPTLDGVEVAGAKELEGARVVTTGLLEKWIVTARLLEEDASVRALFGGRGPGTYYRLVHPATGELVGCRRAAD